MEQLQVMNDADGADVVGLDVRPYETGTQPYGMSFLRELKPVVVDPVATGINTGTPGIGVTITGGPDTDDPVPDTDPGGDPPG